MHKLVLGALTAVVLAGFPGLVGATVTWSFYETGISCQASACNLPPQPYVLATLALPGPTSIGTARWQGVFGPAPVYTGDDFVLSWLGIRLSPAFTGHQNCSFGTICDFDIGWSATAGGLDIGLNINAFSDNIGGAAMGGRSFGRFGGPIASDGPGYNGGCVITRCEVTGFWQSDLAVSEPMSAALLLTGLFGFSLVRRHREP
jgi:hypothetical protein